MVLNLVLLTAIAVPLVALIAAPVWWYHRAVERRRAAARARLPVVRHADEDTAPITLGDDD